MARDDLRVGVDLLGVAPSIIAVRLTPKGPAFASAWRGEPSLTNQIGGTLLTPPPAWPTALKNLTVESPTIGVLEVLDGVHCKGTEYKTGLEVWRNGNDNKVSPGPEKAVKCTVAVPRANDSTWSALDVTVRTGAIMQAVDWMQSARPNSTPLVDTRTVALLRALRLSAPYTENDIALVSHLDVWDSLHIFVSQQAPRIFHSTPFGIAHLALAVARTGVPLEDAFQQILAGEFPPVAAQAFAQHIAEVAGLLRAKVDDIAKAATMHDSSADSRVGLPARSQAAITRWVVSGAMADFRTMESVDIPALHGAERTRFRPVAELSGVSSAILATAGAYTTAFGHALNVRGTRDFDALPLDLTVKIPLLLLPSERRDPLTILEQAAGARQRSRSGAQSAEPKNLGGVAAVMYAIALAIMAIGFGVPTARGFFLGRQIRSGVADTLAASARILNAKNIEADAALQAAKHGAISRIQGSRHESQEMLEATARAMVSVPRNLWLTSIQSAGASELRLDGTTREYAAIGLFEDGLRATAAFGPVQLDRVTQHDREWTFSIRATRHIAGGQ